jgi:CheY-like chemotaxis protein
MSHRILVVDDNEDVVHITASFLTAKGYAVDTAVDGERALAQIAAQPPDCILLDVMMPDMSGIEVLNRLKEQTVAASIPVISSAKAATRTCDRLQGGADHHHKAVLSQQ